MDLENKNFRSNGLKFDKGEINQRARSIIEASVPGRNIQSDDFSPKLNVVDGQFSAGQAVYNVGTGFFLGIDDGAVKFSIGNGTTDYITWDGTNINIRTSINANTVRTTFTQHISGATDRLSTDIADNNTAHVGLTYIPSGISVNRMTIRSGSNVTTPGVIKVAIYSEDGQTKIIEETSATISATFTYQTITLATPVYLEAGVYYTAVLGIGTIEVSFMGWKSPLDDDTYTVSGGKVTSGYLTVTADTLPATFNPVTDIAFAHNRSLVLRLDNI